MEPMRGVGESEEFSACAVAQAFARHFGEKEGVTLAPEDAGGYTYGLVWKFNASSEKRAIPVDHAA